MQKDYFKKGDKVFIIRTPIQGGDDGLYISPEMFRLVNDFTADLEVYSLHNRNDWITLKHTTFRHGGRDGEWYWTFRASDVAFASSKDLDVGDEAVVFRKVSNEDYPRSSWPEEEVNIGSTIGITGIYDESSTYEKHLRGDQGGYYDWRALAPTDRARKEKEEVKDKEPKKREPLHELLNSQVKGYSCCHWALRGDETDYIYAQAPCHAGFSKQYNWRVVLEAVENIKQHEKELEDSNKKDYRDFVEYILNRSPWKECFLTKDVDKAFDEGVYYNVEMDHAQVLSAAVALRTGSEFPHQLLRFTQNVDEGWAENVSLLMAYFFDNKGLGLVPLTDAHHTLSAGQSAQRVLDFFGKGQWNVGVMCGKPFRERNNYHISRAIAPNRGLDKIKEEDSIFTWLKIQIKGLKQIDAGFGQKIDKFTEEQRKALFEIVNKRLNG